MVIIFAYILDFSLKCKNYWNVFHYKVTKVVIKKRKIMYCLFMTWTSWSRESFHRKYFNIRKNFLITKLIQFKCLVKRLLYPKKLEICKISVHWKTLFLHVSFEIFVAPLSYSYRIAAPFYKKILCEVFTIDFKFCGVPVFIILMRVWWFSKSFLTWISLNVSLSILKHNNNYIIRRRISQKNHLVN